MRFWVFVVATTAFIGLFAWAYTVPEAGSRDAHVSTKSGFYDKYTYSIATTDGRKEKTATFTPAVKGEDGSVVAVLREMVRAAYGQGVSDQLQPVVEDLAEEHYVVFKTTTGSTYFQLFKNEVGEVGAVSFWQEGSK